MFLYFLLKCTVSTVFIWRCSLVSLALSSLVNLITLPCKLESFTKFSPNPPKKKYQVVIEDYKHFVSCVCACMLEDFVCKSLHHQQAYTHLIDIQPPISPISPTWVHVYSHKISSPDIPGWIMGIHRQGDIYYTYIFVLQAHQRECPFGLAPCPNRCSNVLFKRDLAEHVLHLCELRNVQCPNCGATFLSRDAWVGPSRFKFTSQSY